MKRKEISLMQKMTRRVLLLFGVLLIISVIYSFFLVRFNGYSNMQKICYDESEMMTVLIDNLMYDMNAVATNYATSDEIRSFLQSQEDLTEAQRIQQMFHVIEDYKPSFLTHKYFHSFCLIDGSRNSYYSFNNPGVSFLGDFEKLALQGERIDAFTGFTGAYSLQSSGRTLPFNLFSVVRDIYAFTNGARTCIGKVIITANIGEFLRNIQKETSLFDDVGLLSSREKSLFLQSWETGDGRHSQDADDTSVLIDRLLDMEDIEFATDGLWCKSLSQDPDIELALYKANASYLEYTDAYIVGFLIIMVCITAGTVLLMLIPVIRNLSRQIRKLEHAFEKVGNNEFGEPLELTGGREFIHISSEFNRMTDKIQENTKSLVQQERKAQDLKFELLIAQMNPHFIYNTLNLVIYLARKNRGKDVIEVTASFISLLQNAVYFSEEGNWSTVEKELEMTEKYQLIQKYRYGTTITFYTEVEEDVRPCRIPRNILIPLIENALLHGICETDRDGTIRTSFSRRDGRLRICVADDGRGMTAEALRVVLDNAQGRAPSRRGMYSIGLSNIYDRLSFLYQEDFTLDIHSEPDKGTEVVIELP